MLPSRRDPRILLAGLLFLGAGGGRARAAFETSAAGAQATAMSGAGLASRGDSAAMFLNAAGVAGLPAPEGYFLYNRFYAGLAGVESLSRSFLAFGVPTKAGSFAIGLDQFQASGLLQERVIGLSFARRWFDSFEAGVTAKYLHHRFILDSDPGAAADPVFSGGTGKGAFALDFGVAAAVGGPLTAGLAARNVNRPDVGLATPDPVARELQGSLAYDVPRWRLRLTADYAYRELDSGSLRDRGVPGIGVEKALGGGRAKFRAGATLDQFGGGVGVTFHRLTFDYAFVLSRNLVSDNAGTHLIGVRWRFADVKGEEYDAAP